MKLPLLLSLTLSLLTLHVRTGAADDEDFSGVTSAADITNLLYSPTNILTNVTNATVVDASTSLMANLVIAIMNTTSSNATDQLYRKIRSLVPVLKNYAYDCSACQFCCYYGFETQSLQTSNSTYNSSDVLLSQRLSISNSTSSTNSTTSLDDSSSTNSTASPDSSSTNSTGTNSSSTATT